MSTLRIEWVSLSSGSTSAVERILGTVQTLEATGSNIARSSAAPAGATHARIHAVTGTSTFSFGRTPVVNKQMGLTISAGQMETVRITAGDSIALVDNDYAVDPVALPVIPTELVMLPTQGEVGAVVVDLPAQVADEERFINPTNGPLAINANGDVVRARRLIPEGLFTSTIFQTRGTQTTRTQVGFQAATPVVNFISYATIVASYDVMTKTARGSAHPGLVVVKVDGKQVGTTTADPKGVWVFIFGKALAEGQSITIIADRETSKPFVVTSSGGGAVAPPGFQLLTGADGAQLLGADGAPLYGKAA